MNFVVCVKVIFNNNLLKNLRKDEPCLSKFDIEALNLAIRLKGEYGGCVKVISLTPIDSKKILKRLYYYGVDEVIILSDPLYAGSDTLATSYILSTALKKIGKADIVICGEKSLDGETAQVPGQIASLMRYIYIPRVRSIRINQDLIVEMTQDNIEYENVLGSKLPVVISPKLNNNSSMVFSLGKITQNYHKDITIWTNDILSLDASKIGSSGSTTSISQVYKNYLDKKDCEFCTKKEFAKYLFANLSRNLE